MQRMQHNLRFGRPVDVSRWSRYRLRLESLEDRLPLGDALLGASLASWLVGPSLTRIYDGTELPTSGADKGSVHHWLVDISGLRNQQSPKRPPAPVRAPLFFEKESAVDRTAMGTPSLLHNEDWAAAARRLPEQFSSQLAALSSSPEPGAEVGPGYSDSVVEALTSTVGRVVGSWSDFPPELPAKSATQALPPRASASAISSANALQPAAGLKQQAAVNYDKLPLSFEANVGQTDRSVQFLARGPGYSLFLTATDSVMVLSQRMGIGQQPVSVNDLSGAAESPLTVVSMQVLGGNPAAHVVARNELPGRANYFLGNNPSQWHTNVPTFGQVQYENIYPGIDLVYYGNQGQLEYDFVVAPGADPQAIHLGFSGADQLRINNQGELVLNANGQDILQRQPLVYQEVNGSHQKVASAFALLDQQPTVGRPSLMQPQVSFAVGPYDLTRSLVIDPVLSYSTYLGGSGNDYGNGIAVDPATGDALVMGTTNSTDFPTANPWQPTFGGGLDDAFVTRISADGSTLLYSTYLGGSNLDDGNGIAVDPTTGDALVTGITASTDFPTVNALQPNKGGGPYDAFVTRLSVDGSALVYSTYLGGTGSDNGLGIAVAPITGDALVTGVTTSRDFPTANPLQPSYGGGVADTFVARISADGSTLLYSTYLGGTGDDEGYGIAVDPATGDALITGFTTSPDFPTANAWQLNPGGGEDAFVARLSADGSTLLFSTYLGGSGDDIGYGIAVDPTTGDALVTGQTYSPDFPTVNPLRPNYGGSGDAFVARLSPDGSALVYSTYLGGSSEDKANGIAVDPATGDALIAGDTRSADFPTANAVQPNYGGAEDAFVARLSADGSALVFSTYLGGSGVDRGFAIAIDPTTGAALVTGVTGSADFPTVNAVQPNYGGGADAFVTRVSW
jgi:hypothetical protein